MIVYFFFSEFYVNAFICTDGNGFKTSTMRLGADVIVFSRCCGKEGKRCVSIACFL